MSTPKPRTVLVTGFPTFAARYLVRAILDREPDTRLICIVRPDDLEQAHFLIPVSEQDRVQILRGDVRAIDLGLSGQEYLELTKSVTDVYHLDALWHVGAARDRLRQINIKGTANVLQCVRDMTRLDRYNHFSTAFVCGDRSGVIMEEEFEEGQTFLNPYEQTQYEAERMVRKEMDKLPVSIFRPSVIVGHSETGQIDRLTGPYVLMVPLVTMAVDVPLPMPGSGQAPLNLVPVDYVVDVVQRISTDPRATGRTFHIIDPDPLSARRVFELVAMAAGKRLPRGRVPISLTRMMMKMPGLERVLSPGAQALDDFNRWCLFNALNTSALLEGSVRCPAFPEYVGSLVDYIQHRGEGKDPHAGGLYD